MSNETQLFISESDVAKRWGFPRAAIARLRRNKRIPEAIIKGGHGGIRYSLAAIEKFEEGGLLTKEALAKRWGVTARTIEHWQERGDDFGALRLGGYVRYRLNKVIEYENGNK